MTTPKERELIIGTSFKEMSMKNGDVYRGWVAEKPNDKKPRRHGGGECKYKSGEVYFGGWRDDERFGFGKLKFTNGDMYEGSWSNDRIEGYGLWISASDHSEYRGEFVAGKKTGRGVIKYPDGTSFEGSWLADKKHGKGILFRKNGPEVYGLWENDEMTRNLDDAEKAELKKNRGVGSTAGGGGGGGAGGMDEYEYVDYEEYGGGGGGGGGAGGAGGEDGGWTSLFGWDAIRDFFMGGPGDGKRRRRKKRKETIATIKSSIKKSDAEASKAAGGDGETAKRRIGVSAEAGGDIVDDDTPSPVFKKSQEETKRIGEILKEIILFSGCNQEQLNTLITAMFAVHKNPGDQIIKQGEEGDNFYIVDQGEADVYISKGGKEPTMVASIQAGGFFGELALMYSQPRAATIKAKSACQLWALDRITFRKILKQATTSKQKMIMSFLDKVKILDTLTNKEKAELADAMVETKLYNDGEYIITQGERGDSFFIIIEGNARITKSNKPGKGKEKDIATVGVGDYFGEMAILSDQARAASVIAKGKTKCLSLDRDTFTRLLGPAESVIKQRMQQYEQQGGADKKK